MDPDDFLRLDSVIHAPIRLAVLSVLTTVENARFTSLRESTSATDGNLSTHLAKLEKHGFIAARKTFEGKRPQTLYSVTDKGRMAFAEYLEQLKHIVKTRQNKGEKTAEIKRVEQSNSVFLDFSPENPYLD
jgi:DNA-binding PadR family transcriptional regulator